MIIENHTTEGRAADPKWAALVNDTQTPLPRQNVKVSVIRQQAGIPDDHALIRDHNSDHDPVMDDEATLDLAHGNVFYSISRCDICAARPACAAPAKFVYVIDDRWEIVTRQSQTGRTLRDLFNLKTDVELLRDLESPNDVIIGDDDDASVGKGSVFRTRNARCLLFIYVNKRKYTEKEGVRDKMTGLEIAALDSDQPDKTRVERIKDGVPIAIGLTERVEIVCGDTFKVIRCNINAGFQDARVCRELDILREGGLKVTLVEGPVPSVIYHDVPVRAGLSASTVDVLVKIPPGYPGGIPDNAFLPAASPLLDCTPGAKQHTEIIGGAQWTQKSIHPHASGGVDWNKEKHGLHTYFGEIQNWLHASQ